MAKRRNLVGGESQKENASHKKTTVWLTTECVSDSARTTSKKYHIPRKASGLKAKHEDTSFKVIDHLLPEKNKNFFP